MTEHDQKQLGNTLWAIADQLRGAMNADDFRDYMLSFLFMRYLSDNYEAAAKKELGMDYKGIKMPRGYISLIKKDPFVYPSKAEQIRIADCLSSIDELITAQTQKLDKLKAHKKGLMQQLFPSSEL
ncbi:MAG: type I restriction-modification system subunit M N-terminal domain-containing protein [Magnetococcus sp. YQC-5]